MGKKFYVITAWIMLGLFLLYLLLSLLGPMLGRIFRIDM